MTGELAIEDRASATTRWLVRRFELDLHAYAAYTQWWAESRGRFAMLGDGATGGVHVSVTRDIGAWRIETMLGAGRSWYGALDANLPRASLAAQGTLALRREWRTTPW